jgi:hypothetical protein
MYPTSKMEWIELAEANKTELMDIISGYGQDSMLAQSYYSYKDWNRLCRVLFRAWNAAPIHLYS